MATQRLGQLLHYAQQYAWPDRAVCANDIELEWYQFFDYLGRGETAVCETVFSKCDTGDNRKIANRADSSHRCLQLFDVSHCFNEEAVDSTFEERFGLCLERCLCVLDA